MLEDLNREPSGKFINFCWMSAEDFEHLLNEVGPIIKKQHTNMRKAIHIQDRLAVTLRFLATGDSFTSLSYLFKFSNQIISNIVHEVCYALIHELKDQIKVKYICNQLYFYLIKYYKKFKTNNIHYVLFIFLNNTGFIILFITKVIFYIK